MSTIFRRIGITVGLIGLVLGVVFLWVYVYYLLQLQQKVRVEAMAHCQQHAQDQGDTQRTLDACVTEYLNTHFDTTPSSRVRFTTD